MTKFLWVIVLSFAMVASGKAQDRAVEQVIKQQISAFRADDFAGAFGFASANLQRIFKSPQNFEAMIKQGYTMVIDPAETRFLEQREIAGALWQKLLIRDRAGVVHILDYQMVPDGETWRINAVQLLQAPGVST